MYVFEPVLSLSLYIYICMRMYNIFLTRTEENFIFFIYTYLNNKMCSYYVQHICVLNTHICFNISNEKAIMISSFNFLHLI